MLACRISAEYVLEKDALQDVLYLYDKLNSYKVAQEAQAQFPHVGAYYNNRMRCLVFPISGSDVLRWLQASNRVVLTEKVDYEGAQSLVEPLAIPDDL